MRWRTGIMDPKVPLGYDANACVSELRTKQAILNAWQRGWQMVPSGCVPQPLPPPSPVKSKSPQEQIVPVKVAKTVKCVDDSIGLTGVQVCHFSRCKIHIYRGGQHTVCVHWKCGSPQEPSDQAVFQSSLDAFTDGQDGMTFCKSCYGSKLVALLSCLKEAPPVLPSECGKKEKRASSSTVGKNVENLKERVPSSSESETDNDSWLAKLDEFC